MNNRHDEFHKTGNLLKDNQTRVARRNKRSFPALHREGMTGELGGKTAMFYRQSE
ncbi:hypothetical protein LH408_08305 [Enterobacter cloacae]|uniref:hypothetical protein n=1 Tax=Enterobacter cloacae TaxID=550 RepID=UPI001D02A08F|nr:hypothetical protein [Enterobacter cloacae]UDG02430.1 hypothetical protein LH408_08305 [Enterobacter cloacae]